VPSDERSAAGPGQASAPGRPGSSGPKAGGPGIAAAGTEDQAVVRSDAEPVVRVGEPTRPPDAAHADPSDGAREAGRDGRADDADAETRDADVAAAEVRSPTAVSSPWAPLGDGVEPAPPDGSAAPLRPVRTRRLLALVAAAALIVAAGLVAATYTPLFAADAIRVRGAHHLTKAEILRASGLERGVNVFHLDADAIEARIEREPWVAEATLTKELPGTLVVTIRERVPVAVVNDGSVERLVADDGGLLGIGAPSNLPRIVADEGATTTDAAAVRSAADVVAAMRPDVRRQVAFVRLLRGGDVALELRSGITVVYGSPDDATSKAQALTAMLRYAERTGERYTSIDVSVPTAPAGTLVGG
jgi:cell division protein FtsQ